MATQYTEFPLRLRTGVDKYQPPIMREQTLLQDVNNLNIFRQRVVPSQGKQSAYDLSKRITSFGAALDIVYQDSFVYTFLEDELMFFNPDTEAWESVFTYIPRPEPFAVIDWAGILYVTRHQVPITRVERSQTTEIDSAFAVGGPSMSARYGIVSHGHLLFANIMEGPNRIPTRVRWSDVDNPERFHVDSDAEADFFDLDVTDSAITGLANLRGLTYIFTGVSIWIANYQGLPQIYRFEPISEAISVPYHNSVVSHRNVGFFIGSDNIYAIEGQTIQPIGNPVWPIFEEEATIDPQIVAYKDERRNQIMWVYNVDGGGRKALLFNYQEGQWSYQDGQKITAGRAIARRLKSAKTIDYWDGLVDSFAHADELIDGPWQDVVLPFSNALEGTSNGHLLEVRDAAVLFEDTETVGHLRTYELEMSTIRDIKKVAALQIYAEVEGTPVFEVRVGTRDNQMEAIQWHGPYTPQDGRVDLSYVERSQFFQVEVKWTNTVAAWLKDFYAIMLEGQVTDAGAY